jgi:hypothetical protein
MAFSSTITETTVFGNKRVAYGTFTNGGSDTGGDIETGLDRVDAIHLVHSGSAVVASAPVVNETFPLASGDVTIVTVADADGFWIAYGA